VTLKNGTPLGPYIVDTLLGAGGMGEVYRARDSRLDRTVAIKVLLPSLTAGEERRVRFEREARAISALSSPHICAIFDVGRADDVEYLVMEYLEGETLAERIARGPLPLSQILRIATEIAEALRAAHRAGITHRDLKPGNVMLTASGVKLLDFGLAKLEAPKVFSADSAPATIVNPITAEGTIVGTVLYMAPEQLEGRAVDPRTDIFALGVIMYEMVTGQRPFAGSSPLSIISAVISSDPIPIRSLQPACPAALERIILTALEKNPEERWQTANDLARQLRWLAQPSGSTSTETLPVVPAKTSRRLPLAIIAAAAIGGVAMWGGVRMFSPARVAPQTARLNVSLPDEVRPPNTPETPNMALSPDGRTLAFGGESKGKRAIYLRPLDSYDMRRIDGSEDGTGPFWSGDGQWIGFSARGKLWKTKAAGSSVPIALVDMSGVGGNASWVGDTILYSERAGGRAEVYRVSDQGGTPVKVTTLKANEWRHSWPLLLADGRHYLYQAAIVNSLDRHLVLASLDSNESSVLTKNISQTSFVSGDQLVFVRDGKLLVQRIDIAKGVLVGEPALIADNVAYFYPSGRAAFDALNGTIVYLTDTSTGRLVMTDRTGKSHVLDDQSLFQDFSLSFSPDGNRAAVTVVDRGTGLGDIWLYDLVRGGRDRFSTEPGIAIKPVWSPDGQAIVYSTGGAGTLPRIVRRGLTSSTSESITPPGRFAFAGSFSPDGSTMYFSSETPSTKSDIVRLDLRTRKSEAVMNSAAEEHDPQVSPDGKWLAFSSDASGASEVYLQSLTRPDLPRVRISTAGGDAPCWRRDGGELFYVSQQDAVMSAVPQNGEWNNAKLTELFQAPHDMQRFAASPDGQRFLFIEGAPGSGDSIFNVILGWR